MFSEYMPKKDVYRFWGFSMVAILFSAILYRVFFGFLFSLGYLWWESFIWLGFGIGIIYLFFVGPFYHENKAYRETSKLEFYRSNITKDKTTLSNPMLLPVVDKTRIVIDLKDAESLKSRLESELYSVYRSIFMKQKIIEDLSQPNPKNRKSKMNLLAKVSDLIKKLQDPEKTMDAAQIEAQSQEILSEAEGEGMNLEGMLSLDEFNTQKLKEDADFLKNQLGKLDKIVFFHVLLEKPRMFPDETEEDQWDQLLIITEDTAPNLLDTHKARGLYNRWLVNYRLCKMSLVYWRKIGKEMPLFYLDWSQNQSINDNNMMSKLNKESNTYLQLRVDDVWLNHVVEEPDKLRRQKNYFQQKAEALERDMSNTIQDLSETSLIFGDFMADDKMRKLEDKVSKYKKRSWLSWGLVIALIGVFIGVIALIV